MLDVRCTVYDVFSSTSYEVRSTWVRAHEEYVRCTILDVRCFKCEVTTHLNLAPHALNLKPQAFRLTPYASHLLRFPHKQLVSHFCIMAINVLSEI